AMPMLRL
uniref:Catch-relaxing peptide n=1 Tax=Mytilus edulis TaxID=6550 RepID=CARP_MYTED|nr:RecName: Full=Catch-relaxing peptide; Short=CARP [Mytilus edulis]